MKIKYDKATDNIYFILSDKPVVESEEIEKDVIVDYDENDRIVAIEILKFSEKEETIDLPVDLKKAS